MKTSILNSMFLRTGLCATLAGAAILFSGLARTHAQDYCTTYTGTLSFHGSIVADCPLVGRGDSAEVFVGLHDCITFLARINLGEYTFSTVTSAGVPMTGRGTLILDQLRGVLRVTAVTVGDPTGEHCDYANLKFHVGLDRTGL
jgi:hypothetical protein